MAANSESVLPLTKAWGTAQVTAESYEAALEKALPQIKSIMGDREYIFTNIGMELHETRNEALSCTVTFYFQEI